MSLNVGRTMLVGALKELQVRWEAASDYWDDRVSQEFAERHLEPMEPRVRAAVAAMEDMMELINRAKRECQ